MKLLLDAHALLWAIYEPQNLSAEVAALLADTRNELFVSLASIWEIASKAAAHRLPLTGTSVEPMLSRIAELEISIVPVLIADLLAASALPRHHADPFDRMLVAQARRLGLTIVTSDDKLPMYAAPVIW